MRLLVTDKTLRQAALITADGPQPDAVNSEVLERFHGWTLHCIDSLPGVAEYITVERNLNGSARIELTTKKYKDKFSGYVMPDGSLIVDKGSYLASMLSYQLMPDPRDPHGGITDSVMVWSHLWFLAFDIFQNFRPETVDIKKVQALNAKRAKGDAVVTVNDYILKLTPEKIQYIHEKQKEREEEHEKRTNRYHMARGHYRHYKSGKVVWVKEHYKGDKSKGVINKDYMLTATA